MKKILKLILPVLVAIMTAIAVPHLSHEGECSCQTPIIIFGSLFGCGESKQQENPNKTVISENQLEQIAVSAPVNDVRGHKVTFVEIGSVNCIPCKAMQPIMRAVEQEFKGQVKIVFYDIWTPGGRNDAMKYNIRVIPTQVFLDSNGREYFRHEGFFPKEDVVAVLKMKGVR